MPCDRWVYPSVRGSCSTSVSLSSGVSGHKWQMPSALVNNNAGDVCDDEAGASQVATMPHVMIIRRIKTIILRC